MNQKSHLNEEVASMEPTGEITKKGGTKTPPTLFDYWHGNDTIDHNMADMKTRASSVEHLLRPVFDPSLPPVMVNGRDINDSAIISPPEMMAELDREFHFDFDPCPYPRPEGYNSLTEEWGDSNYCNPLFWGGGVRGQGVTAFVKKALLEAKKGRLTVLNLPVDGWVARLIEGRDQDRRVRRDWYWLTPRGEKRKPSRTAVLWIVRPNP